MEDLYRCIKCEKWKPEAQMNYVNCRSQTGLCRTCANRRHYQYQLKARARWTPIQWDAFREKRRQISRAYRARVGWRVLRWRGMFRKMGLAERVRG